MTDPRLALKPSLEEVGGEDLGQVKSISGETTPTTVEHGNRKPALVREKLFTCSLYLLYLAYYWLSCEANPRFHDQRVSIWCYKKTYRLKTLQIFH